MMREKAGGSRKAPANEANEKETPKVVGKYRIATRVLHDGDAELELYEFSLYANNGQLLYESHPFASRKSCEGGIETFKKCLQNDKTIFMVDKDKNGQFRYIIKSGGSIYQGESYSTRKSADNSKESVKRFGLISPLVD